jgi:hypothetical protein
MSEDEVRAFNALAKHPKMGDLVALTRELAEAAAKERKPASVDKDKLRARAKELGLSGEDASTELGDALAVLERGPEDAAERALACALYAHVLAENIPKAREEEDRVAGDTLWLAAHTPFDATRLLDRALGESAGDLWGAVAERVRVTALAPWGTPLDPQGKLGRGEVLLGCAALAMSSSEAAQKHATRLAAELKEDPVLTRVLSGRPPPSTEQITGELTTPPRGPLATAALAFTGLLFVIHGVRLIARLALSYRHPAVVTFSPEGVKIQERTLLLGRTLRDREVVIARAGLVRAAREVRYPRVAFYTGLLALALGSYIGVLTFADGVRAASPSLLLLGILIVGAGIGLDLVLRSLLPGSRGRCSVLFLPRRGKALCVTGVDAKRADVALAKLAEAPG